MGSPDCPAPDIVHCCMKFRRHSQAPANRYRKPSSTPPLSTGKTHNYKGCHVCERNDRRELTKKWRRNPSGKALHYNARMAMRPSRLGLRGLAVLSVSGLLIATIATAQPAPVLQPDVVPTISTPPAANATPALLAQTSRLSPA